MSLIGSQQVGLGSVHTAAGDSGSGGASSGGPNAICAKFSGSVGDTDLQTTVYLTDDGDLAGGSAVPMRYPTSARTITALRLSATIGTGSSPPTATLFKNGVATLMTCTLGAGAAPGDNVVDIAHPITFADGDTFDVELTADAGGEGPAPYTATLEGTGGNVGTGVPYDGDPADVLLPGGTPDPGVSSQFARGDHVHVLDDLLPFDFLGTYFSFDVDATGALNIFQTPATSGVDFDQHPALRLQRNFDTFPSAGLLASFESRYRDNTPFGDGGSYFTWANYDEFDNRYDFARMELYREHTFLTNPGYSPAIISSVLFTYWRTELSDENEGGHTNRIEFNSNGGHFRECFLPAASPHTFYSGQLAMNGLGGEPAVGSELVYDSVTFPTGGWGDNLYLGHASVVLDAKNFGSAQAVGHLEFWARGPTLVDGEALGLMVEGDRVTSVQAFRGLLGAVVDGGATVATGNLVVAAGDADISGDAHVTGDLTVAGAALNILQWFELDAGAIDPTAVANYTITPPAGFYFIATAFRTIQTALDGTLTSAAIVNAGNDAAKVNIFASAATAFGTLAQINTAPTGLKQYSGALNSLNPAVSNVVDTATPFTLQVTTGAVLNTATTYRVRVFLGGFLVPH